MFLSKKYDFYKNIIFMFKQTLLEVIFKLIFKKDTRKAILFGI